MKAATFFLSLCLLLFLCPMPAGASCPGNLDDNIDTPLHSYSIDYTNDNTDPDFFSDANANRVSDALDDHHDSFTDLSFLAPFFNTDPSEVCCYDSSNIGGANFCQITLDTPFLQPETEPCIRLVTGHELFHHVQYAYINNGSSSCGGCGGTWGKWTCEGTARLMQDKIYDDLDQDTGCITYLEEINDYLANPNITLTSASYKAALFWNYLTEQLGSVLTEPERGSDLIEAYWANTDPDHPDSMQVLRDTLQDYAPGSSLENIFHDFSIINYAKELDVSGIPGSSKYFYIDETAAGGGSSYDPVSRSTVSFSNALSSSSVNAWAARYFEVDVDSPGQCEVIGFRGEAADNDLDLGWTVIGIKSSDRVVELHKGRGSTFYKAFLNNPSDPFVKLAAVVTGLNEGGSFDYVFAAGLSEKGIEIRRPTFSRQAYVGEHASPDRFQVRVLVTGPPILTPGGSGVISVKGLSKDDFSVFIENGSIGFSEQATVLTGAYVGGEYWLSCQAPVADEAAALYNVRVCLCETTPGECGLVDIERNAVVYAKLIRNQMLVLDRSGSMSLPSATPKLDAAQAAANIFVDAAADDDLLGVVSFTGDGTECNDDSELRHDLQTVSGNRLTAKGKIDGMSAGGLTGLGDGMLKAQDRLGILGSPAGVDHIVLMSDGMENEARCWDSTGPSCSNGPVPCDDDVKPVFETGVAGSGTIIDAIAFGPQTDQALMQDVAATGAGDYYYVDVSDATSAAAGSAPSSFSSAAAIPADLTLGNRISEVYLAINDKIQHKDRIFFVKRNASAGSFRQSIELSEGKIERATFAFNWEDPSAVSGVRLYDPNGSLIGPGDAQILRDDTHTVFQFNKTVPGGKWQAEIDLKDSTQYMVAVSGTFRRGVQARLYFSQVPAQRQCLISSRFLAGLPVTVLVSLADIRGGVRHAEVQSIISLPNGELFRLPLFDDGLHDDGEANDGIYGNVFTKTSFFSQMGVPEKEAKVNPGTRGSYVVSVIARGRSNLKEAFTRYLNQAFQVYECFLEIDPDYDNDGLPDRYEQLYPCLDYTFFDSDRDQDKDGLSSKEEYRLGSNPCDADTDDGGEIDGSEAKRGANLLDPGDDLLPRPYDAEVITNLGDEIPASILRAGTNTIRHPVHPSYENLRLFRGTSPKRLVLVDTFDPAASKTPGIYFDEGLTNGVRYYYQLIAEGKSGAVSMPSPIFSGMPKRDPFPPRGWVLINRGLIASPTIKVKLSFDTGPDNVLVRVSNDPTFGEGSLQAQAEQWMENPGELDWELEPDPETGRAAVYVQYQDDAGNTSVTYHDSIIVDEDGDLDNDGVRDGQDNCLQTPNKDQSDVDKDGVGDACDNCPRIQNPDQRDSDFDGQGNACDPDWPPDICEGDFDGDDDVDGADLSTFAADFGRTDCCQTNVPPCEGDFDDDCDVDGGDLSTFASDFGRTDCP